MRRVLLLTWLVACGDSTTESDPQLTIISPADGATITGAVTVVAEGRDLQAPSGVMALVDNRVMTDATDGNFSGCTACMVTVTFPGAAIADGTHTIELRVENDLNVIGEDKVTVIFDRP